MAIETKKIRDDLEASVASSSKQPVTVIIGTGPGGLSAAFSLILRNHKVILIDNRGEDTRKQRIYVNQTLFTSLFQLSSLPTLGITFSFDGHHKLNFQGLDKKEFSEQYSEELKFFKKLADENCVVSLKSLKEFMLGKLKNLIQRKRFSYESIELEMMEKMKIACFQSNERLQALRKETDAKIEEENNKLSEDCQRDFKVLSEEMTRLQDEHMASFDEQSTLLVKALCKQEAMLLDTRDKHFIFKLINKDEGELKTEQEDFARKIDVMEKEKSDIERSLKQFCIKNETLANSCLSDLFASFNKKCEKNREKTAKGIDILLAKVKQEYEKAQEELSRFMGFMAVVNQKMEQQKISPRLEFEVTGDVEYLMGSHYQVVKLDGQKQTLLLRDSKMGIDKEIHFDHFVSAEGAKHEMVNLLSSSAKEYSVTYSPVGTPRQSEHAVIVLKLKEDFELGNTPLRLVGPHLMGSSQLKSTDIAAFEKIGWKKDYLPAYSIDFNSQTKEFYIFTEVSQSVTEAADTKIKNELLRNFGEMVVKLEFDLDVSGVESLAFSSVFKVQSMSASTSHVELGKKGIFYIIGDALLSANPLFGHGVEKAITDGNALYSCFSEKGLLLTVEPLLLKSKKNIEDYYKLEMSFEACLRVFRSQKDVAISAFTPLFGAIGSLEDKNKDKTLAWKNDSSERSISLTSENAGEKLVIK